MAKQKTPRVKKLHNYYKYTGFYSFIMVNLKKAILPIVAFVCILLLINRYVININDLLVKLTENFSDWVIFIFFYLSESILGIIPPDIFIAWTKNTESPILYMVILTVLSYLGGVTSYFAGLYVTQLTKVQKYMETKMSQHINNMKKWGGFLIAIGALLPLPFAIACFAAGMIKFPKRMFFLFALLRIFRFLIYGYVIYSSLS